MILLMKLLVAVTLLILPAQHEIKSDQAGQISHWKGIVELNHQVVNQCCLQ